MTGQGTNAILKTIGFLNYDLSIRKLVLMSRDFIHATYWIKRTASSSVLMD